MATVNFFNQEDFNQLQKFAGQSKDNNNPEMLETYSYLKETYNKMDYWAREVQNKIFPNGHTHILKKPTNQANIFQEYQWAKIYPNDKSFEIGKLAFALVIIDFHFEVKIDTVGLGDKDQKRQKYLSVRGDVQNSSIVKIFKTDNILSRGWDELIVLTIESIKDLEPDYLDLIATLFNQEVNQAGGEQILVDYPLNTIFYGPPGTGKTYNTIVRAISIANPKFSFAGKDGKGVSRKEVKEEYSRMVKEKQIAFTSFHQSVSYEDFIEGIKPQKPQPNESFLKYDIEDGIFKAISKRAQSNYDLSKVENRETVPFEDAFQQLKDEWENEPDIKFPLKTKGSEFTIIGFTNSSIQFRKASGGTGHTLSINTLRELYYGKKYDFNQGVGIYYPGILNKLRTFKAESAATVEVKNEFRNYVLIIDEINRGNISQIFGELITLIEEDKRFGMPEALAATLPYSKEEMFSVPPNLYIIGTMNTADRSVEALDTALRRRFSFEFMPPIDLHVTEELEGVPLREIFNQINERISFLLDGDHQIGHSYFISVKELDQLTEKFKNKIIPLLKEYFFNDYRKIYLVLGEGFVKKDNYKPKFAVNDNEEMAREIYSIIPIDEKFDIKNALTRILAK